MHKLTLKVKSGLTQQCVDISKAAEVLVDITDFSSIWVTANDSERKLIFQVQVERDGKE